MVGRFLGIAVLILATALPATAAEMPRTGKAEVHYTVDVALIEDVFNDAGFKTTTKEGKEGDRKIWNIYGEDKKGFLAAADIRACDVKGYPKGCLGVRYVASVTIPEKDKRAAYRAAELYNREEYVGKAWVTESGKSLYFEIYLMVDGGVTRKHLDENFQNFLGGYGTLIDYWEKEIDAVET